MGVSVPITWNGVAPRRGSPDPLRDVLGAVLLLFADRGERVRWRSTPTSFGLEVHLLVSGTWYEMVPPFWKMPELIRRLAAVSARSWWDRLRLWRQHRRHIRDGEPLIWERTVVLPFQGEYIPATCCVHCEGLEAEVELAIPVPGEKLSGAAAAVLPDFSQRVFERWSIGLE